MWHDGAPQRLDTVVQLAGSDPKAANTFEQPNVVVPRTLDALPVREGRAALSLPPLSFTVLASA